MTVIVAMQGPSGPGMGHHHPRLLRLKPDTTMTTMTTMGLMTAPAIVVRCPASAHSAAELTD